MKILLFCFSYILLTALPLQGQAKATIDDYLGIWVRRLSWPENDKSHQYINLRKNNDVYTISYKYVYDSGRTEHGSTEVIKGIDCHTYCYSNGELTSYYIFEDGVIKKYCIYENGKRYPLEKDGSYWIFARDW